MLQNIVAPATAPKIFAAPSSKENCLVEVNHRWQNSNNTPITLDTIIIMKIIGNFFSRHLTACKNKMVNKP